MLRSPGMVWPTGVRPGFMWRRPLCGAHHASAGRCVFSGALCMGVQPPQVGRRALVLSECSVNCVSYATHAPVLTSKHSISPHAAVHLFIGYHAGFVLRRKMRQRFHIEGAKDMMHDWMYEITI